MKKGGHDIPETDIRKRWVGSQLNLIRLLPYVTTLQVHDNSAEKDPARGKEPEPKLVLSIAGKELTFPSQSQLGETSEWAKPLVYAAYTVFVLASPE